MGTQHLPKVGLWVLNHPYLGPPSTPTQHPGVSLGNPEQTTQELGARPWGWLRLGTSGLAGSQGGGQQGSSADPCPQQGSVGGWSGMQGR